MKKPGRAGWATAALTSAFLALMAGMPLQILAQDGNRESAVVGIIQDAETGEAVAGAQVLLEELRRSAASGAEGRFEILNLRPGTYTLRTFRIGYEPLSRRVEVSSSDTLRLALNLTSSTIVGDEIFVEGRRADEEPLVEAVVGLEGRELRRNLGTTIAETLSEEPGIAMQSMGPATARPVLRGMGGERLLVLEDGGRPGDLSQTSSDHALVIDPLTAERVEVLRGPAALIYGSNTLAGVVNVERGYVPTSRPSELQASVSAQAASANRGYAGGMSLTAPLGPFALQVDGSARQGHDMRTPVGVLENTEIATYNGSAGASWTTESGYAGLSGSYYGSDYGIPGGFVGAHPNGVSIGLNRYHLEGRAAYEPSAPELARLEARGTFSRYFHQEFESSGLLGAEFGLLSYHGSLVARTGALGPFTKGAVGLWSEYRDYASGGFVYTPASTEHTLAGFAYQEAGVGPLTLEAGIRYDIRSVDPREEHTSELIGQIRRRNLGGLSASAAGSWQVSTPLTVGVRAMRSLRMPGISELYSEGPHLAAYTFEVGNPTLDEETGHGGELFANYRGQQLRGAAAVFYNYFTDYIFPRNTGGRSVRTLLPIYQYSGANARMLGGEASAAWQPREDLSFNGSLSYVRGTLIERDVPLPEVPPLRGKAGVEYEWRRLTIRTTIRAAAAQDRVYHFLDSDIETAAERPTDGYVVLDASAQYYFTTRDFLHTLSLSLDNVLDETYRDHLSRVRVIMPEPGRNIRLLYRMHL